ncbi:MAG: GTP pyrophosphokinase, partial [Lachnospiraceae bacterium]|nr:GTP pyrophosphokinase [Lachnospiraceae bacterium]
MGTLPENEVIVQETLDSEIRIPKPADYLPAEELFRNLMTEIQKYHPSDDLSLVEKAYRVAKEAHRDQKRKSGEPYIIHPLNVALILA